MGLVGVTNVGSFGINRSEDASNSSVVLDELALNQSTSSTNMSNQWSTGIWNFGNTSQFPVLKWITSFDIGMNLSSPTDDMYTCNDATGILSLLMPPQTCGNTIPGQGR